MGTNSTPCKGAVAFLVTINLFVCTLADANHSEPEIASVTALSQETSTTSSSTIAIQPLPVKVFSTRIPRILSPDIFSQPDPLTYLLNKLINKVYNAEKEIGIYQNDNIKIDFEYFNRNILSHLEAQTFPRRYVRYARLLSSLLACMAKLHMVSLKIRQIQRKYSTEADYPQPPTDISTPELRSLFSTDIFSDPSIPSVLLNRILEIPDDRMPNLMADLWKLSRNYVAAQSEYKEYIHFLVIFLEQQDKLDRLRYQNAEIQRRLQKHNKMSNAN